MKQIVLSKINFPIKNSKKALFFNNLNISIDHGEFVTILGHNGSGKTLLALLISGFLEYDGNYYFEKELISKNNLTILRRNVGIVFQNPDNQIVSSIVDNDIAFGLENKNVEQSKMTEIIDSALNKLSILELKKEYTNNLSGGQKQKVVIAGQLALDFNVIIFDESTAMLDPYSKQETLSIMKNLNKKGTTIIHITHDVEEIDDSNRVLILENGQIIADDLAKNIWENKELLSKQEISLPFRKMVKNKN